jgi:putative inorganic carbon (hco3(-)) transporter
VTRRLKALVPEPVAAVAVTTAAVAVATVAATAAGLGVLPALVIMAAVPLAALAWRTDPAWPLSLGIATGVFSGNWGHLGVPLGPDRLLIATGLVCLALRAPGARERPALRAQPVHWLLAVVVLYAAYSALLSGTLSNHRAVYGLLDRLALPCLMFFVAPAAFATARQRSILLTTLVVTGGYLGLTALFETLGLRALVFPRYILDPAVGIHQDRARGPFVEAVANGMGLYACGVAAAIALVRWRRPRARIAAVAVLALCATGVVFTLTRAVWIASAAGTVAAIVTTPGLRRHLVPVAALAGVLVFATLLFVPGLSVRASARESAQIPVWARLNTASAALHMIADRPLVGFGWGRFVPASGPYYTLHDDYPLYGEGLEVHNVFLARAVDLGLIGAALWLAGLIAAVGGATLTRGPPEAIALRAGLVALLVDWVVVANFGPLGYAFPNILLWTWAGVVWQWRIPTPALGHVPPRAHGTLVAPSGA